jgi:hypothetical protein
LSFYGILAGTIEGFDAQVLLDPFVEQLDLPTTAIQLRNGLCWQVEIVAEKYQNIAGLGVSQFDAAQLVWIELSRNRAGQYNRLIADQPGFSIDRMRVKATADHILLCSDNKEGASYEKQIPITNFARNGVYMSDRVSEAGEMGLLATSYFNAAGDNETVFTVNASAMKFGAGALCELGRRSIRWLHFYWWRFGDGHGEGGKPVVQLPR